MENWQYYGLFIDKDNHDKLIDVLVNSHWIGTFNNSEKKYLDHCTLLHNSQKLLPQASYLIKLLNSKIKDKEIEITIDAVGISNKAMAFRVILPNDVHSINKTPHVTICTFNGGKPVESNNITDWYSLEEPVKIKTTLKKI